MVINKVNYFEKLKRSQRLDEKLLVICYGCFPTVASGTTMTVQAYKELLGLMEPTELASHYVTQVSPVALDALPDEFAHIWTVEDVMEFKKAQG